MPGALEAAQREAETGSRAARGERLLLAVFAGDLDRAEAMARGGAARGAPAASRAQRARLAMVLVQQGRWREARLELDRAEASADGEQEVSIALLRRANLVAGRRSAAELRSLASSLAAISRVCLARGHPPRLCGDVEGAEALAGGLVPGSAGRALLDAVAVWQRGNPSRAADLMASLLPRSLADNLAHAMDALVPPRRGAPQGRGATRRRSRRCRRFQGVFAPNWVRPWAFPRSRLLVARSLAALGRRDEATEELARLTGELRLADADDPALAGARQLAAELRERESLAHPR